VLLTRHLIVSRVKCVKCVKGNGSSVHLLQETAEGFRKCKAAAKETESRLQAAQEASSGVQTELDQCRVQLSTTLAQLQSRTVDLEASRRRAL
jgi:hypothetical protein